jgi:dipeptidyl aminopeptidase/acylaminoacyl peptidase
METRASTAAWPGLVGALALLAGGLAACRPLPGPAAAPATPSPALAARLVPTLTASATPSPTATATPHPLTIEAMRQRSYPGSAITVEEELAPGANYTRYRVWYLSEGLRIYALMTVPNGDPPPNGWPAIIFNHGYIPPDEYRTTERYVAYVDHLARHRYVVFRPDYRGHDRSEGVASGAYGSPDYVVDVLNALASVRAHPGVDAERVGMWGHSMGGYITLRSMVIDRHLRAGVIWAGVVGSYADLLMRWRPTPTPGGTPVPHRRWRFGLSQIYGSPEENPEFWASISANTYLQDLSGPIQLHHGTADTSVPQAFSEMLHEQIQQAGGVSELYLYPGADHNLSQPFTVAMQRTIEFFDRYLKGA